MRRFLVMMKKEIRLLLRDGHGLLVLFAMPALFILIMSLALRDNINGEPAVAMSFLLSNQSEAEAAALLAERLATLPRLTQADLAASIDRAALQMQLLEGTHQFAVLIPPDFQQRLRAWGAEQAAAPAELLLAPGVSSQSRLLLELTINYQLQRLYMETFLLPSLRGLLPVEQLTKTGPSLQGEYVFRAGRSQLTPSAVQQSVPAWLVFGMFFVVIPLATALLVERQQGSLVRLQVMRIPPRLLLGAKIVPYFVVNQLQVLVMLLVGMYLVPALGGDALNAPQSWLGLGLISTAASLAAIGFALLLATSVRSNLEATTLGGGANILLAAIGGIMVPKFVMPQFMQELTVVSPMAWGLEGFLDVFLRGGSWQEVLPEAAALLGFAGLCLSAAIIMFKRQMRGTI